MEALVWETAEELDMKLAQRVRTALLGRGLAAECIWLRGRKK